MLEEALDFLDRQSRQAHGPHVISQLSDEHRVALDAGNGEVRFLEKKVPDRQHKVLSLESFVAAFGQFQIPGESSVWVAPMQIVGLLRHGPSSHRADQVLMQIEPNPVVAIIAKAAWMTQKKFVELLRHDLAGCDIDPPTLLSAMKFIKIDTRASTTGKIENSNAAMGNSIEAEVTGASELPELVTVEFHPYPGLAEEINVSVVVCCSLFVDASREGDNFKLAPQPGSLEEAQRKALKAISEALQLRLESVERETPVLLGTP